MSRTVGLIRATEGSAAGVSDYALAQCLLITGFHHMQNRCFDTFSRGPADTRFMDASKVVKLFAEEIRRDTGLALECGAQGKICRALQPRRLRAHIHRGPISTNMPNSSAAAVPT